LRICAVVVMMLLGNHSERLFRLFLFWRLKISFRVFSGSFGPQRITADLGRGSKIRPRPRSLEVDKRRASPIVSAGRGPFVVKPRVRGGRRAGARAGGWCALGFGRGSWECSLQIVLALTMCHSLAGQLVIVANDCDGTITRQNKDGSWVVAIPRG